MVSKNTKRVPLTRSMNKGLTPAAVRLFRDACMLWPTRAAHLEPGKSCGDALDRHCAACAEYDRLCLAVYAELGLRPHHMLPFDFEGDGINSDSYWRARLEEALTEADMDAIDRGKPRP